LNNNHNKVLSDVARQLDELEVKRVSENLYVLDQFYIGDFAQILIGVYNSRREKDDRGREEAGQDKESGEEEN